MPTIKEVARRAGVSVGTASHVLNGQVPVSEKLRKRVEAAIAELDYHPSQVARSLSTRRTHTLGMVIPDIANPFFPQVIRGVESVVTKSGFSLITFNTDDQLQREKEALTILRSRRVDGILLVIAPGRRNNSHIASVIDDGIVVVCLDRVPSVSLDCVSADNFSGSRDAIRHLIAMGHRDIAIVTGPLSLKNALDRLRGYKTAFAEAGLPVSEQRIKQGDFRQETGQRICQEMFSSGKRWPTAMFFSNNLMAIGGLEGLSRMGLRCPDDFALATFDGFVFPDVFHPTLTTVVQPAYEIGARGAEILIQRLDDELAADPVRIELPTELRLQESTLSYVATKEKTRVGAIRTSRSASRQLRR
jgi:DNA-binding LacI/PurR family transcriptional regulator